MEHFKLFDRKQPWGCTMWDACVTFLGSCKNSKFIFSWNLGVSWADIALLHSKSAPVPLAHKNLPRASLRKVSRLLSQSLFPSFRLHKLQSWETFPWVSPLFLITLCRFNSEVSVCFFLKQVAKTHYPVLHSPFGQCFTVHKANYFEEHGLLIDPAPKLLSMSTCSTNVSTKKVGGHTTLFRFC